MSDHSHSETHDDHGAPGHHGQEHAHGGSLKTYIAVFFALCVLTTASFMTWTPMWGAMVSDNKHVAWAFMMAVSCTKALLVILFFMHLKYEANWKYVLTIPAAFMSIFLALMLVPDIGMRWWHYSRDRLLFCAVPTQPDRPTDKNKHDGKPSHDAPAEPAKKHE